MSQAVARVRDAVDQRRRCFLSTPNLNFAVAARTDASFRDTVFASDLSVVDGKPLVWIARLLGVPLRERVAGASLFERLRDPAGPAADSRLLLRWCRRCRCARLRTPERRARRHALRRIRCARVRHRGVDELARPARSHRGSGADFVVVALGARKGQAWIEHNLHRLKAPVVSHLGAVVNFVAGKVQRAPPWMGQAGLEWLWRILQEPALWRRYAADAWRSPDCSSRACCP